MPEPMEAAYEAADRAISELWATPSYDLRRRTASAAVDAVRPLFIEEGRRQAAADLILATDMHQVGFLDADGRYWPGVDLHAPDGWEPVYAERKEADHG